MNPESRRTALLLFVAVLLAFIFGPHTARGETAVPAPGRWVPVENYPAKWKQELGTMPGEIVLSVEHHCGKPPLYTLRKSCGGSTEYSSIGWYKGQTSASGRACGRGRWLMSFDLAHWESRGGVIPNRPDGMCEGKKRPQKK